MENELKDQGLYYQILIFLVLAAGIIIAGYLYYQSYEQEFRSGVENQLTSVGDMKVDELVRWRLERQGDAQVLYQNPALSSLIREMQQDPDNTQVKENLKSWLSDVQTQYQYSRVYLLNGDDQILISSPDTTRPISSTILENLPSTRETGEITLIDFYQDESDQNIYLTILIPVTDDDPKDAPPSIIALEIDPSVYLYPYISRWPTPSSSAETLLLRVEGDNVLYLNELRFREDTALSLRLPLNQTEIPAVKATTGTEGIVEGVDYRGVPVIAYVRAVPDSPWFLVTRIDRSEVFAPLGIRVLDLIIIEIILLLGAGLGLFLFRKKESERFYRKQFEMQEALHESEERLRLSLDAANDAIWDWNVPTGTAIFSPRWYSMLGYEPGEMPSTYETWRSLLHPDDLQQTEQLIQDCIQKKEEVFIVEFRMQKKQGEWAWILARGKIIERDEKGDPIRMVGTHTDISERKRIEISLRESEEKYREFFTTSRDCVFIISPDGIWVDFNHVATQMFGYEKPSDLAYTPLSRHFSSAEEWSHFINSMNTEGGVSEYPAELIRRPDLFFDSSITASPLKNPDGTIRGYIGTIRDVTERRQYEKRIKRERERLFAVLDTIPSFVYLQASDYTIPYANRVFHELFGEIEGRPCYEVIQKRDSPCEECLTLEVLATGRPVVWEWTNDEERTFMIYDTQFPSEEQNMVLEVGIEITDLKRAEREKEELIKELSRSNEQLGAAYEELTGSEEELRYQYNALASIEEQLREKTKYLDNLITYANVPIIVWDPAYIITQVNHAFENLVGSFADQLIGQSIRTLFPPDQAEHSMKLIETTKAGVRWDTVEIAILHRDGAIKTVIWNSATLYSPDGETLIATIAQGQDITQRKRLEKENDLALKEIQKNLAQLSILNDQIRNPLMIILMAVDMIGEEESRDLITGQISRIDDMVNQLDTRWIESEKVLTMIRKNYKIFASPSSDQILSDINERTRESDSSGDEAQTKGPSFSSIAEVIQAELYTILDSIDAFVYVADLQTYELLYMNRLGRRLFGDIAGKKCFQIIQKEQDGPCPFCTNHLLTDEIGPTGVHHREIRNTRNGRWYDCRDRAIRWSDGRLVHLQIGADITDRKNIEDTLKENEYTFRKLFEESSDPILLMQDNRFIECNQATLDLLLISGKDEFIGLTPVDISPEIQPDGRLSVDAAPKFINRAHTEGRSRFEWMVQRSDGTPVLLEVSLFPIIFKGEEMLHVTWRDITKRKAGELALKESKDELKRKLDAILSPEGDIGTINLSLIIDAPEIQLLMDDFYSLTKIGVAIVDSEGNVLVATGWQDICTRFHRVHPETCKNCIESDTRLSSDVAPGTYKLYRCRNNMWDMATPIVVGGVHLGSLFLGQFLFDDEVVDYAFFREQAAIYGFDEEAYIHALEQVPRWSRNTVDTVMRFYSRLVLLISEASWGSIHLARIVAERDALISTIRKKKHELEAALDESSQLTEELHERDEELRQQVDEIVQAKLDWEQIFQSIGSPALILDTHHRILDANPIVLERTGRNLEELKGMYCWEIFHGEGVTAPPECCPCEKMILSNKTETSEMEVYALNGIYLITCSPIFAIDGSIDRIIHIAMDITEKKNAEKSLSEVNQKLRLLTSLTRHDILNQVQIIQSLYELCKDASDTDEIQNYVSRANTSAERISSMIGFTRIYEKFGMASLDWQPVHQTIVDAVSETTPEHIPVDIEIPRYLEVYADPIIRKVFVNLIENAIRHGGEITRIKFSSSIEENTLKILCDDDGIGVPLEEKGVIFEQGHGKNTGVGLFLSKEILSITGLFIRECGVYGEGARFEITVPAGKFRLNTDIPSPR